MAIRAEHVSEGHLHGVESLSDELRHVLIGGDCLDSSLTSRESRRARQRFWREMAHFLRPLQATILQETERRLVPLDEPEQSREQVQRDPVASTTIHLGLPLGMVHAIWLRVALDIVLHLFPEAHARYPIVGQQRRVRCFRPPRVEIARFAVTRLETMSPKQRVTLAWPWSDSPALLASLASALGRQAAAGQALSSLGPLLLTADTVARRLQLAVTLAVSCAGAQA